MTIFLILLVGWLCASAMYGGVLWGWGGLRAMAGVMVAVGMLGKPGEAMAGGIGNLVYFDMNWNRVFDPEDQRVPGVFMHLYREGDVPGVDIAEQFTTTDSEGRYLFSDVPDGRYFVYITPPNFAGGGPLISRRSVPGTPGAADSDDEAGENGLDTTQPHVDGVRSGIVVVAAGQAPVSSLGGTESGDDKDSDSGADEDVDLTVDFGFQAMTTRVGDRVWLDDNRNGLQDAGEPGLGGVEVQLFSGTDALLAVTTSAPDGYYTFTGLGQGVYYVRFPTVRFPLVLTKAEQDPADLADSDAHVATGNTPLFTVLAGEAQINVDAGYVVDLPDVGGFVFHDQNADGVQDAGEAGLEFVPVVLLTEAGVEVASTETDAGGYYQFSSVTPGSYYLNFPTNLGGLVLSPANQSVDDFTDSDPDRGTGSTEVFAVQAGLDDQTWYAGYHAPPATIRGMTWRDLNRNGLQDAGEPALPGVAVALIDPVLNVEVAATVSGEDGTYEFGGLTTQAWQVQFPRYAGADERYQLTTPDAGLDDIDSDAALSDGRTAVATPESGEDVVMDAGYKDVPLGLGNGVFIDYDGNGLFNTGEGVPGVEVQLFAGAADPLEDDPLGTVSTSGTGIYNFSNLLPGQYFVRIPPSQSAPGGPLAGWVSLPGNGGDDGMDDNADENGIDSLYPAAAGIRSPVITLSTGNEPVSGVGGTENGRSSGTDNPDDSHIDLTVDFGFHAGMTLGNLVFIDADGGGKAGSGEGVSGVQVELYGELGVPGTDAALGTVTTDSGGSYYFRGVVPGKYRVHLPAANFASGQPLAGLQSLPGNGTSAMVDDDADENGIDVPDASVTGISSPLITLAAGSAAATNTGETGMGNTADDADVGGDTYGNLTVDFGFAPGLPETYSAWQQQFLPSGTNAPGQDADGDGLINGYEYLYHLPASGGTGLQEPLSLSADPGTGKITAVLRFNPRAGDAAPVLQVRSDLRDEVAAWQEIPELTPVSALLPDGREEWWWEDLESVAVLSGGQGFVRVTADLDTDGDGTPEASLATPVLGWQERVHPSGPATVGIGMVLPPVFRGTVESATGENLDLPAAVGGGNLADLLVAGESYYVEIAGGTWQGHRFEVDEAGTSGTGLRLAVPNALNTMTVPDLTGALIVVRKHWTLNALFPVSQFEASTDPANADRIMTYPRPGFAGLWLADPGAGPKWVHAGDPLLADAGGRPVPPGEGLFLERRTLPLTVLDLGEIRPWRMARVLTAGNTLQASGWPVAGSPDSWDLLQSDGFTGSTNPAQADGLQIWRADVAGGQQAFQSYFLLHASPPWQHWAAQGDPSLLNRNAEILFAPGRAVFLQLRNGVANSFQPCPWNP